MYNLFPCLTDTQKAAQCVSVCVCVCVCVFFSLFNDLTQWARTELGHSFSWASGVRDDAIATTE